MIKNIVSSLIALAVVATPVAAEARNRDGNGWEQSRGDRHHKRSRISTGEAIAIGVGAFILGAATSSNRRTYERAKSTTVNIIITIVVLSAVKFLPAA
jgi:Ni/Co efflux regulator RcnB